MASATMPPLAPVRRTDSCACWVAEEFDDRLFFFCICFLNLNLSLSLYLSPSLSLCGGCGRLTVGTVWRTASDQLVRDRP